MASARDMRLSLTERTHALLKEDILKARRRPESLLIEQELAQEYGVSKTPIREALRLLAHEGWVMVLPRKGYLVRPLRFEDVREVFALRQMIEPTLVVEAAERSTPEQLDALERHIDDQEAATDTEAELNAATAFHVDIAALSGNRRAERMMVNLGDEVRRMHYLVPSLRNRLTEEAEIKDHRDLMAAMRRVDIEQAYEIMDRHSQESLRQKLHGLTTI
ncbi:GntR family transcriptional regulator [Streptomyces canus]|uniref:GntR family transcriptional regulator n=1 Tax=Streptomyces canus TaxID=58343 RepID=UPI003719700C